MGRTDGARCCVLSELVSTGARLRVIHGAEVGHDDNQPLRPLEDSRGLRTCSMASSSFLDDALLDFDSDKVVIRHWEARPFQWQPGSGIALHGRALLFSSLAVSHRT